MKQSKLMKLYRFLVRLSPWLRLTLTKWLYNKVAANNRSKRCVFLNYGYNDDTCVTLNPQDEHNRYFIQLYQRVIKNVDLLDKDIVEVGCGQGAGGIYLLQYKKPHSYIGIDLSEKAIKLCSRYAKFSNAQWLQGQASALPINNNSVDVLVNVESSHCYPSIQKFLAEVVRVLRPNGYMAYADLCLSKNVDDLSRYINESGLQVVNQCDITPQVLDSLARLSDRRKAYINSSYSVLSRQALHDMAAVKNSSSYNGFVNGEKKYLCYLLQKKSKK